MACFPGGMAKRRTVKRKAMMTFKEDTDLSFKEFLCIVATVHEHAARYRLISSQCYWSCVRTVVCCIFADGIMYNPKEMRKSKDGSASGNHRLWSKVVDSREEGQFVLEDEDTTSLVDICNESWQSWEKQFADAGQPTDRSIKRTQRSLD
ncbi:hypothetical protein BDZ89DRAFT_1154771 [Hymenopellis radicata]|nr:hypothetical protein BDZ89DRAFT_1154771 [Hymenopellis radicata]